MQPTANNPVNDARGMMRVGGVIALLALALILWGLFSSHRASAKLKESTEEQAIDNVSTVRPTVQVIEGDLTLPGSMQANYDAPIYARTSGYLKRWLVDIGTPVKEGQILAEIDAPEVDQQLRQAQADVANARASQKLAKVTADRWRDLRNTDSVSSQQADEKISQSENGDAQLQSSLANLQRLRDLSGFKTIVAPFDGIVTARNTDVGQLITAGGGGPELFRVADTRRLRLYVRVPQAYSSSIRPGMTALVLLPERPGVQYIAKVDRTSEAIDIATRTLLVELIVDNANHELYPGAYAEVHFKLLESAHSHSFKLPTNSVLFRGDGIKIATVDAQNRVKFKPVTVGRDYGVEIELTDGVDANDTVIVNPPESLLENAQVRIVQPADKQKAKQT